MSDLGELLKKAREQSGLSLDDIQESTKIRKRYLEAIEAGDYKVLPGTFYVRAFVKTYAETLGLNADDVLRLYKHEMPAAPVEASVEPMIKQPRRASQTSSDRWSKFGFTGIMLSFVIVIAVVVWIYAINNSDTNDNAPKADDQTKITDSTDLPKETEPSTNPQTGADTGTDTPDTTPVQQPEPPPVPDTTVTLAGKSGRVDLYDVGPSGKEHVVKVTIKGGTSWLEVREGGTKGKELYYTNATDGTVQTFTMTDSIYVSVGRADLVEITVDDILVEDGNRTSTKKMQFNPVQGGAGTGTGTDSGAGTNTGANAGTDTGAGTGAADQEGEVQNVR